MQLLRFNSWLKKSLHEQKESQRIDYSDWRGFDDSFNEDLSGSEKKNKILLLKKLLSNFDKYYHYSDDSRVYRKGKEQQDEIEKLVKEIGKDGLTKEIKTICPKVKSKALKSKYIGNYYDFFYNFASDSGNVPSC